MTSFEEVNQTNPEFLAAAREHAAEIIAVGLGVVDLTEVIIGMPLAETAAKRDETILPRDSVVTPAKVKAIRAALTEIGIGMNEDRGLGEAGLSQGAVVLIEGGHMHKIVAETHLVGSGPVVFSGTKHRPIAGTERETTARIFELADEDIGANEYDMASRVARNMDGFEPTPEPIELGRIAYDGSVVGDDYEEEYGTVYQVGTTREGGQPVYVLDVPRRYLFDEQGDPIIDDKNRQRFVQPSAAQQAIAVAELLHAPEVAVATSSTYYPSRLGEIVRASFSRIRQGTDVPKIDIVAYCPARLAKVKREDDPAVPTLANMLGEAYAARQTLLNLQAEIAQD